MVDTGTRLYQFGNLHVALVRDCLLANDVGTLGSACLRRLAKDDLCLWFDLSSQPTVLPAHWQLIQGQNNGQRLISGVSCSGPTGLAGRYCHHGDLRI